MVKKLKICIVGLAHQHAIALYESFAKYPDFFEWIGCTDVEPLAYIGSAKERMDMVLPKDHEMYYFDSLEALLDKKPDIALVCTDNKAHADVCEILLTQGVATVVEKPMAVSLEDGLIMARASRRSGTPLVVNWPVTWFPASRLQYDLLQEGAIGRLLRFHYRNPDSLGPLSHGETVYSKDFLASSWWYKMERGGGAMLDYCGYGCLMASWYFGSTAVWAYGARQTQIATYAPVEDFSTMTIGFPGGIAMLEGSWATVSNAEVPTGPLLFGDEGTLVTDRYSNEVKLYKKLHGKQPDMIYTAEPMENDIALQLRNHLLKGEPLHETLGIELNLRGLAALQAGLASSKTGRRESVKDPIVL